VRHLTIVILSAAPAHYMIVILSGASARFSAIRGFCGSRGRAVEGAVVQRGCNTDAEIRYSTPPI